MGKAPSKMTLLIHGYSFDKNGNNTADSQYEYWRKFSKPPHTPFYWQSTPPGRRRLHRVFNAWKAGHLFTYYWAWAKSTKEAQNVVNLPIDGKMDIVCHSLGSRVAYEACRLAPGRFRKVLAFNGADSGEHARECALAAPDVEFTSVMYDGDKVLGLLGRTFTPAFGFQDVIGHDRMDTPPPNFTQIELTKEEADGPGFGDHSYSFENPELWNRWAKILA